MAIGTMDPREQQALDLMKKALLLLDEAGNAAVAAQIDNAIYLLQGAIGIE